MHAAALIIGLGWIAFWLYWIVSAFGSKKSTVTETRQFFGIRLATIILAAVLVLLFNQLPPHLKNHLPATNGFVLAAGLAVFCLGAALAIWARLYLGENWGMPMTEKPDTELVTTGPYRYIRHPIYSGILLMTLGSAVDVNSYWLLVFIVAAVLFIYSAVAEERLMMKQFPKAYPAYKSTSKMLIPFVL